jgi:acetyl-CoA synthase
VSWAAVPRRPGFVGHSKYNITQKKFILGDGGLLRMVWMPKVVKDELYDKLNATWKGNGYRELRRHDRRRNVGVTEEEILPWLQEKGHPALSMDPIIG